MQEIRIAVANQSHEVPVPLCPLLLLCLVVCSVKVAPQRRPRITVHLTDQTAMVGVASSKVGQQLILSGRLLQCARLTQEMFPHRQMGHRLTVPVPIDQGSHRGAAHSAEIVGQLATQQKFWEIFWFGRSCNWTFQQGRRQQVSCHTRTSCRGDIADSPGQVSRQLIPSVENTVAITALGTRGTLENVI